MRGSKRPEPQRSGDYVESKPPELESKKGKSGETINLITNYFTVQINKDPSGGTWRLYQYRVDYEPEEDNKRLRKGLIKSVRNIIGPNVFDGQLMYISKPLKEEAMELTVTSSRGNEFKLKIRLVKELNPTDPMYVSFYSNLIKKCQEMLGLDEMGRNYFDRHQSKP
jgi:aubergine-like protein